MRGVHPGLGVLLLSTVLAACRARSDADHSAAAAEDPDRVRPAPGASRGLIPNAELVTESGRRVHFYDDLVFGHTVVIQFFFTECQGACPGSTANLLRLQQELGERLGRDISILSITLDPEHDTPVVLARHAREIGSQPGWTFLTGERDVIEDLRHRLGVYELDPVVDADRTQHAGIFVIGSDAKQRWMMQPALIQPGFLARSILRVAGE